MTRNEADAFVAERRKEGGWVCFVVDDKDGVRVMIGPYGDNWNDPMATLHDFDDWREKVIFEALQ